MLAIFSKFGSIIPRLGKKKTIIESLEEIDKEIKNFEKYKQKNEQNERKYIGSLVIYSILLYIIGAILYYVYLLPTNLKDRLITSIPFFISPVLIYSLRRFLKWFFIKRTKYYAKKLEDLNEEKKTILEDVKEKETYKKAREILERFGNGVEINITPPSTPLLNKTAVPGSPHIGLNTTKMPGTNLIQRNVKQIQQNQMKTNAALNATVNNPLNVTMNRIGSTSSLSSSSEAISLKQQVQTQTLGPVQNLQQQNIPPPPSSLSASQARTILPRPIITPNRTFFDKILDFIIGEGPNNRYALICKNCHFHNGMALREEFEYVAFRCAYCLFYNEARKTKLNVPVLNKRPDGENTTVVKANNNLNESGETSTLSSSDSMNDIDQLTEQLTSESQKISISNPSGDNKTEKKIKTKSLDDIKLDQNEDKHVEQEDKKVN